MGRSSGCRCLFVIQTKRYFRQDYRRIVPPQRAGKGASENPMTLYKRFRGQEPTVDALLEKKRIEKALKYSLKGVVLKELLLKLLCHLSTPLGKQGGSWTLPQKGRFQPPLKRLRREGSFKITLGQPLRLIRKIIPLRPTYGNGIYLEPLEKLMMPTCKMLNH